MTAVAGLNRGLLVSRDDEVVISQGLAFPLAGGRVQHTTGLGLEIRIAGKDPRTVAPRTDGVGGEPSPNRGAGDLGDEAAVKHLSTDIWDVEPRQRQAEPLRKLACNRLDFDDDLRGGKLGDAHAVAAPQARRVALRRIACATSTRSLGGNPGAQQSHRCRTLGRQGGRPWLESHLFTAAYNDAPAALGQRVPRQSTRSYRDFFSAPARSSLRIEYTTKEPNFTCLYLWKPVLSLTPRADSPSGLFLPRESPEGHCACHAGCKPGTNFGDVVLVNEVVNDGAFGVSPL